VIRRLEDTERDLALAIVNDAAVAYADAIPPDRYHIPYMDRAYLDGEIAAGVEFFAYDAAADDTVGSLAEILGVMGIQEVGDVTLVRHAYVRATAQRGGIGSALLAHVRALATRPVLVGTWAAATWAVGFYQRNGFSLVSPAEKDRLLQTYWSIPARQVETSVVLADQRALREIVRGSGVAR